MAGVHVKARFAELRLPSFAPPLWLWTIIGGLYYVLFFFLLRSLLSFSPRAWEATATALTGSLLLLNGVWNWIFFRRKNLRLSFVFFLPYFALALVLDVILYGMHAPLWPWFALYVVYLLYAAWWAHAMWRLNRTE